MFRKLIYALFFVFSIQAAHSVLGLYNIFPGGMEDSDIKLMTNAARSGLDGKEQGETAVWENPQTHNKGSVELTQKFELNGHECRTVSHNVNLDNEADNFKFINTICRTHDQEWIVLQ